MVKFVTVTFYLVCIAINIVYYCATTFNFCDFKSYISNNFVSTGYLPININEFAAISNT